MSDSKKNSSVDENEKNLPDAEVDEGVDQTADQASGEEESPEKIAEKTADKTTEETVSELRANAADALRTFDTGVKSRVSSSKSRLKPKLSGDTSISDEKVAPGVKISADEAASGAGPKVEKANVQLFRTGKAEASPEASKDSNSTSDETSTEGKTWRVGRFRRSKEAENSTAESRQKEKRNRLGGKGRVKNRQTSSRTAKKADGPGFWGWIKRFYATFATLFFIAALAIVAFAVSRPWLDSWIRNEPPAITLPSIDNLEAMSYEERIKLRSSAIRLAPFREKGIATDPKPFEGGLPNELRLYRIRAVGDGVKVVGALRHYEMPDKRQFLRLTDFEMTAGYKLKVLLAVHKNPKTRDQLEAQGFVDLAPLKAEVGPQNYLLPKDFELGDFGSFVIYDELFEIVYAVSRF